MKKFLSNPTVAMILAVIVVLATMLLSAKLDFGKQCKTVSDGFYTGMYGEAPIAGRLREFCGAAQQMVMLGQRYQVKGTEEVFEESEKLLDLLRNESRGYEELFSVYSQLLADTFTLESNLTRTELSEDDQTIYATAQHTAAEAKAGIDDSSYNNEARPLQNQYKRFPTRQLAALTGVDMPQLFA
ncbi:MAG: hypothetical protein ABS901_03045 [Candidatus Limivicinus sp.]